MNWFDLLILVLLLVSIVRAFMQGLLVEIFSLAGVVLGFLIAGAYYGQVVPWLKRWIASEEVSALVAFLVIALGTMILAGLVGRFLRGTVHHIGLGFLDRILGAGFGLVRGFVLVTIVVIALAAFLPTADWLKNSKFVPWFLTAAHGGSHMTPFELGEKIREGIQLLRSAQPSWLHANLESVWTPGANASCLC